jgi:exodeoxyribonuclease V gamma subunit
VGEALWKQRRPTREAARLGEWREEGEGEGEEDFYGLATEGPEALRRWGRPGRENIRLLNDVSECDFDTCFEVPREDSLLHRLQGDVLRFEDPGAEAQGAPDGSVRFLACPTLRRETEVVATDIWRLMEEGRRSGHPLSFSDIAVVVPPAQEAAYTAHLQAAFQETHSIPWTRGEGAPPVLAQTLEAATLLLDLPLSGFTRAAMLGILAHPALRDALGETDPGAWTRWCQSLGIIRGVDREDWAGTYLDQDALNWDQGLRRLALGAYMAPEAELDGQLALGVADEAAAGRFLALARGLLEDARGLLKTRQDLRGWVASLETYLTTWLSSEDEPAVRAVERIRSFLRGLLEGAPEGLALPPMGYAAARHLALEALARLKGEQPSSLSRGVVVSCYAPMRAIPFRAVFLLGLGEGVFPGRDQRSALDLRAKGRRPGDVAQAEKDKYLFLETLLSTREHFCCSFVAKDELTGEDLEPSGLFKEFQALAERYVVPELRGALFQRHPLRRFDPVYFPGWFPEGSGDGSYAAYAPIAQAEARALWLGRDLRQGEPLALPRALGDLGAPPALQARLQTWLALPGSGRATAPGPLLRLSLPDLRKWLECPLTGAAAVRLGLRGQFLEDRATVEDEPFESPFLDTYGLQREVTLGSLREGLSCEAVYDAAVKRLQGRGEAPFGVFAQGERRTNLKPVHAWLDLLGEERPVTWRLGANRSSRVQADHAEPPLALTVTVGGEPLKVELVGDLQPQLCGGSLFLENGKVPSPRSLGAVRKKALRAYLDHLVLACSAERPAPHLAWFFFAGEEGKGKGAARFAFDPLTPAEAREILGAWVRDLLEGDHAMLMPIEAVLDSWDEGGPTAQSIREFVEGKMENRSEAGGMFSTLYGPVPSPERYEPPPEPRALAERRLGPFLAQVRTLDVGESS